MVQGILVTFIFQGALSDNPTESIGLILHLVLQ